MANPEHLEILKRSVEEWNQWRKDNPDIKPDLPWADLFGADLSGADLSKADVLRANLSGANLSGAKLRGANLNGAYLSRADLRGANLRGAYLSSVNLSGVNLSEADLHGADLSWADLSGADLSGAIVGATTFGSNDLSSVTGIGTVEHMGPSTIGIDTIYNSGGKIPDIFTARLWRGRKLYPLHSFVARGRRTIPTLLLLYQLQHER